MDSLWKRYEWIELKLAHQWEEEHPEVVPKTQIEEIHAWEDWACAEVGI